MLKDPRWDKEPSLAGFALFVASKNPNEHYEWQNCQHCAVGQYLAAIGDQRLIGEWIGPLKIANDLARAGLSPAYGPDLHDEWTFGQLADRILAYQRAETVAAV